MNAEISPRNALWNVDRVEPGAGADGLTVARADAATADNWSRFVAVAPRAELYHDYRWRLLIEKVFDCECHYLLTCDSSGVVHGVLPLVRLRSRLFGDFLVSVPYFNYGGLLADSPTAERVTAEAAGALGSELGVAHIELRHRAHQELAWPVRDDKVTMHLELPASEDLLFKCFDSKLRAQIRRPQKAGATCRVGGAELLADFYAVFARNMRDLGTPVYPLRFFTAIMSMFPEQAKVFVVDLRGKPVAAGLVLRHRDTLEIPWASALREANRDGANMLLYWSVLRYACESRCRVFDFGRSSKDSGPYRFKEQWGARAEQLRWHYWLPRGAELPRITPSNPKYRLAISVWKRLPVPVANVLGPCIVKNLP